MAFAESADSKYLTPSMDEYIAKYEEKSHCVTPRDLHLDRPARTVTCRKPRRCDFGYAPAEDAQRQAAHANGSGGSPPTVVPRLV